MNKAAVYLSLLFVFMLSVVFYLTWSYHIVDYEEDGVVRYKNLDKEALISDVASSNVFIIRDKNLTDAHLYRVGNYQGDGKYMLFRKEMIWHDDKNWTALTAAVKEEVSYPDTLGALKLNDIRELIYNGYETEGARILEFEEYAGTFDFIDNSVFIFFAIAVLWFIGLLFLELLIVLGKRVFKRDLSNIIYGISLLAGIRFIQMGIEPMTYPVVDWQVVLWPVIMLLPVYLLYQWLFKWRKVFLDKPDLEALKFVVLLFGIVLFNFLGLQIISLYFKNQELITFSSNFKMTVGMGFAFALGNLMFNISKHLWSMRGAKKKLSMAYANEKESKAELNAIQSSVNPHFLYNALNSIAALAKEDPERTEKMTLALSEFYKYNTNREEKELSTINEELEMIRTYLEIEKIRFEDRLQYEFDVEERVGTQMIPHFLVQPIVENAIKYGYDKKTDKISVMIKVRRAEGGIETSVFDNGEAFSEAMQKGFGLKSVTNKLNLLYPESHELSFVNLPKKHVRILLKETRV